jgi:hypothetical protein
VFNTYFTDLKLLNKNRNNIRNNFKNNILLRNFKIITDKSKNIQKKKKALLQDSKEIGKEIENVKHHKLEAEIIMMILILLNYLKNTNH